jgi:hypothetical protein
MKAQIRAKTRNRGRGWAEYHRPDVKKGVRRPSRGTAGDALKDENGAKTDGTKWCHIYFYIFIRKQKRIHKYRKKNKNGYFRKQKWNEYGTNTDKKRMIIGTKRPPESCNKTQAS